MIVVPCLLVKNEEVWIRCILTSLSNVFPHIIVCDTGSTDSTVPEIEKLLSVLPHMSIFLLHAPYLYGQYRIANQLTERDVIQNSRFLTFCRQFMQERAKSLFSATHIFLVDGDELYPTKYLRYIADNPMPEDSLSGFTSGIECGELENGELWFYGHKGLPVGLNRQAIIPVNSHWKGEYPFESPDSYVPGSPRNHYFPIPAGLQGFYHLHHTRRSRLDADVYLRVQKRDQFSMRDAPELQPHKFWLKSQAEYRDE